MQLAPNGPLAEIHAGLGETDEAIHQLNLAYDDRCRALIFLQNEPIWDGLRADPRFIALLQKMGFAK